MFIRCALILVPLFLLSACSGASGVASNGYPIVNADSVAVYEGSGSVPDTYGVIGLIEIEVAARVQGRTRIVSGEELEQQQPRVRRSEPSALSAREARRFVDDARRDAGRMGANGLLVVSNADLTADARLQRVIPFLIGDDEFAFVAVYVGPRPPAASGV